MSTSTEIANFALAKLGEPNPLLTLTDNTPAGKVMNRLFNPVRDSELRRVRWKFAIKRTQLSALVAAPDWGYLYQCPLPSDFLAVVQVNDCFHRSLPGRPPMWSIETGPSNQRVIMTDLQAPLKFRYVSRIENTGLYDPLFVEVMACKLALEACEQLTNTVSKKESIKDDYRQALIEAMRADAIENPPDAVPWGEWLDSREEYPGTLYGDGNTYYPSGFVI